MGVERAFWLVYPSLYNAAITCPLTKFLLSMWLAL
jgi:hypothetical protein